MSRLSFRAVAHVATLVPLTLALAACGGGASSGGAPITTPPGGTTGGTTGGTSNTPAPVATVAVTPGAATVYIGRTTKLDATARDASGNALAGRATTWTSSADGVARVDATGLVTAVAAGSATITATSEGKTAEATVTVQAAPVGAVRVAPDTATLRLGETLALSATVRDDRDSVLAGRAVRWTSSAPAVASVDSVTGAVRGLAGGVATISAASEGKTGAAAVRVIVPVATVAVATALDTLEAYDVAAMQAVLRDANGNVLTGRVVRWTTSNPAVATIDSVTGQLTGLDRGTVTVTAASEGKSGTATRVVVIKYRSITAGTEHACDIASGGIVWCWGLNGTQGRIGLADVSDGAQSTVPVRIATSGPNALRFARISTYGTSTCGLTVDGKAYCWGYNGWGELGDGTTVNRITPVAVGGGLTFKQLSVGGSFVCGVATDDGAYCWGLNDAYQFGTGTTTSSHTPVRAAPGLAFTSVSAATSFACGVTTGGTTYCWGYNGLGNLGDGQKISYGNTYTRTPVQVVGGQTFRSVSGSQNYACGLTTGGQGYCWGSNGGRFGNGVTTDASTPQAIPGLTFRTLVAGALHACGITTDDALYCWGGNRYGQLGFTAANGSTTPARAAGLTAAEVSAANISTGSAGFTCAISVNRLTTSCWGRNANGQLGNGTTSASDAVNSTPTIVQGQKPL